MKEGFIAWRPRSASLDIVDHCLRIITEYEEQGLRLTLRQLFYQFVSRDLLPNSEKSYKNLGQLLGKARMSGLIDWDSIEDRGRTPWRPNEYDDLQDLAEAALASYRLDRWAGQDEYAELWVEKAALAGVLQPMARRYHVTLMVNKGYSSLSAMYESARRIEARAAGRLATVLYLGDHDPSGEDMVRDIQDRLDLFLQRGGQFVRVQKLALTMAQVRRYNPPPNPTKVTDSRARDYIRKFGRECWEVDALDPTTLQALIQTALESIIDMDLMNEVIEREESDKEALREAVQNL
jgi:hypothetical protein